MQTILKTVKLSKTFSTGGVQQHVLRNIDLEIYESDFTVVMGASGGGKSTLLYALSGMDTPTLGDVLFLGENIAKYAEDKLAVFRSKGWSGVGLILRDGHLHTVLIKRFHCGKFTLGVVPHRETDFDTRCQYDAFYSGYGVYR